ncbi:MAG TPA: PsbP-related protein, partial [Ktedonobacterales bacterium]|nr:PsbP-related protein [Ktedonobacterales bacterium]
FMRNRISFVLLSMCLLVLAACGSTPSTSNSSATTVTQSTPTSTPATGMTVYTSPDHTYQISYPTGWQEQTMDGNPGKVSFTGPNNQNFEVSDNAGIPGTDPATLITGYCQAVQQSQGSGQVMGTPVVLDGQTWFKAQCGADAQPVNVLIVEVVLYKGAFYQIDYASSGADFQADDNTFFTPMEQSFKFLT